MSEMSRKTDNEHENGLKDVERIAFCCIYALLSRWRQKHDITEGRPYSKRYSRLARNCEGKKSIDEM